MKNIIIYRLFPFVTLIMLSIFSCKKIDNYNQVISTDKTKPDVISNIKVDNFNGGAFVTYSLPKSENLLYVLAQYKINDSIFREVKSSYYSDTIKVDGFAKSKEYEVTLYTVSRAEIKSDPVLIKVHPGTPPYLTVSATINITPDFGGMHVDAINDEKRPIGIVVIAKNIDKEWVPVEQVYSTAKINAFSVRGYDTATRQFGVFITDPWGNKSDTQYATIKPLFEMEFSKAKFSEFSLPSDPPSAYGWTLAHLWDGSSEGNGFHTASGSGMPQTLTFDMGVTGKLSRYKVWDRGDQYSYAHGNPKRWALWGSNSPIDKILPADVSSLTPGQALDSWIFIGYFQAPAKPSGKPAGDNTGEDLALSAAGFEYNISLKVPSVRYIRFQTLETFSGGDFMHMMEISIWGNPQ